MSRRGRKPNLKGTGLFPRGGVYHFRGTDPNTGKEFKRSTGCRQLEPAQEMARKIREEMERRRAGLPIYTDRQNPIEPHLQQFLKARDASGGAAPWNRQLRVMLERAVEKLGLRTFIDLENVAGLKRRVDDLMAREPGITATTMRRSYQGPLRQFSKWMFEEQITNVDLLASWRLVTPAKPTRRRRAMKAEEVIRALYAADALHASTRSKSRFSMRPIWTALLVSAPRITKFVQLDVPDLDVEAGRLRFSGGNERKRVGAGYLDGRTIEELVVYVGGRSSGPLFLSPQGARLDRNNALDLWRAAFSLGIVDQVWPAHEPRDFRTAYLVSLSLLQGGTCAVLGGGAPPGPEKRAERELARERIESIVDRIGETWTAAMEGVDLHAFRKTARTWAIAAEMPEYLCDLHLGHAGSKAQEAVSAFWSKTGQRSYTDHDFLVGDTRRIAESIRRRLDDAERAYLALPESETVFPRNGIRNSGGDDAAETKTAAS